MAYSVDLQYTINEDFSGLQTVTESGQPASMSLQGLESYQTYYTKAVLKKDGVIEDESEIESFQTLPAGTITLSHYQTVRSGYDYDVTYLYSSTYAPSWATLSVNGSTFQGVFDSAQHAVSFLVTGLTPGTAYLDLVTLGDIYGEEASVQGSIITTVVNDIDITSVDTAFTSADVNIEYIVDGGFDVGYVEWWLGTKDPLTDQADGHKYFNNGAETVTISGLNEGTEYKFRASITLADQVTTIVSNVVAASTDTDYSTKYFTIENISNTGIYVNLECGSNGGTGGSEAYWITIQASTNDGRTWTNYKSSSSTVRIATLSVNQKVMIRHTGAWGKTVSASSVMGTHFKFERVNTSGTGHVRVYGNIASLTHGSNFAQTNLTPPADALPFLFSESTIRDASDLYFGSYSEAPYCWRMFYRCSSLTKAPKIEVASIPAHCFENAFQNCTSLTESADLRAVKTLDISALGSAFAGCTSLSIVYAPSVSSWNWNYTSNWLNSVAASGTVYKPANLTIFIGSNSAVPSGWTTADY